MFKLTKTAILIIMIIINIVFFLIFSIIFIVQERKKKIMETLNVIMGIVGNLAVIGMISWFILNKNK